MLDLRHVTGHLDEVREGLARRGFVDEARLGRLSELASVRRERIGEAQALRSRRNALSEEMAGISDKGSDELQARRQEARDVRARVEEVERELAAVEAELDDILLHLPNLPHESTPQGRDESANRELRVVGDRPRFDFEPRDHVVLGGALGILDFEGAARISGSRFAVLRGMGAHLERGLMAFMLDLHVEEHGYTEIWPPALVKDTALRGTGQLPKFADDVFRIARAEGWQQHQEEAGHDLYLIPTAEVPLTNLLAGEILDDAQLPVAYTAYTPCFRSEAGSYGKDTRGLIRLHQFDKVELVRFCRPEEGERELDLLTSHAEKVLERLGLCYRVVQLCGGDMGFSATKAHDIEVWLPGQDAYREISSCSWFGDFQARRAQIRYRPRAKGKPRLVHTLNGSGLAIGRTLVALLEQGQRADGSVSIPEALRPYVGGAEHIAAG